MNTPATTADMAARDEYVEQLCRDKAKLIQDLSAETKRREEAERELADCRESCTASFMLGIERGKEDAAELYEADNARLREALAAILFRDELVEANEGAFSIHALRRVKEIAAAALAQKPGGGARPEDLIAEAALAPWRTRTGGGK